MNRRGNRTLAWRIHYTLVTVVAISVVWWYLDWQIIL